MPNQYLKNTIMELGDRLSFLPDEQIAEIIVDIIDEILPLAILSMHDDVVKIDDVELTKQEYHERRIWGKNRGDLEETIANRRELLEHVKKVKFSTDNLKMVDHGSLLMIAPQTAMTHTISTKQSSENVNIDYAPEVYSSESFTKKDYPRGGKNIQFMVDDSLFGILDNKLFTKFCFTIEKTSRYFASIHANEFIFTLKQRIDTEFQDWQRTVLYVKFPKMRFEITDKMWSSLSNETRNALDTTLKQLTKDEQEQFRKFINNFNVEMDY